MIDNLVPVSLQESIGRCVAKVLADHALHGGRRKLARYEIELRYGVVLALQQPLPRLLVAGEAYVPLGEDSRFSSGVTALTFDALTQCVLADFEPLCAAIARSESQTATKNRVRLTLDAHGGAQHGAIVKEALARSCEFVEIGTQKSSEPAAIRVAVSYEQPVADGDDAVNSIADLFNTVDGWRVKQRVSVHLYDSTALAPDATRWASVEEVRAYIAEHTACLPVNWWRIDMTRVLLPDGTFQVEVELDLVPALAAYRVEFARFHADKADDEKALASFTRYRLSATLGECLYRVRRGMHAKTLPAFCRGM